MSSGSSTAQHGVPTRPTMPKFSFKAALVQHRAAKSKHTSTDPSSSLSSSSAPPVAPSSSAVVISSSPQLKARELPGLAYKASVLQQPESRIAKPSQLPSLSARSRLNSDATLPNLSSLSSSTDLSELGVLPGQSSIRKRNADESSISSSTNISHSPSLSDFGALPRPKSRIADRSITSSTSAASNRAVKSKLTKLPGPPSARQQWSASSTALHAPQPQPPRAMPSPSSLSKGANKVARSEVTHDVHTSSIALPSSASFSQSSLRTVAGAGRATPDRSTATFSMGLPRAMRSAAPTLARSNSMTKKAAQSSMTSNFPTKQPATSAATTKIGMLPRARAPPAPVRTLLDQQEDADSDAEDGFSDYEDLEGPDVSRIRTQSESDDVNSTAIAAEPKQTFKQPSGLPPSHPSVVHSTTGKDLRHRRASSIDSRADASVHEKENRLQSQTLRGAPSGLARPQPTTAKGARSRSSLPLSVAKPVPQAQVATAMESDKAPSPKPRELEPVDPAPTSTPESQKETTSAPTPATGLTRTSSLAALRIRGMQSGTPSSSHQASAAKPPNAKTELGIKTSIIHANPIHPSIAALQAKGKVAHQPISTPEALIKAKKRLSGALAPSASSNSIAQLDLSIPSSASSSSKQLVSKTQAAAHTSPAKPKFASLPRSASRSPVKSSLKFPSASASKPSATAPASAPSRKASPAKAIAAQQDADTAQRGRTISAAEIDANLLASLRVVARKANLDVRELLLLQSNGAAETAGGATVEEEAAAPTSEMRVGGTVADVSPPQQQRHLTLPRDRRAASEDLDSFAGDMSADLMALDLASPDSDASMLRSPPASETGVLESPIGGTSLDFSPAATCVRREPMVNGAKEDDDGDGEDQSCTASPSLRAAASRLPRHLSGPASSIDSECGQISTPTRRADGTGTGTVAAAVSVVGAGATTPGQTSVTMSTRARNKLRRMLRESLALEAHFSSSTLPLHRNSLLLSSATSSSDLPSTLTKKAEGDAAVSTGRGLTKSTSGVLLTEDDRYLDELVDEVARIGIEDMAHKRGEHADGEDGGQRDGIGSGFGLAEVSRLEPQSAGEAPETLLLSSSSSSLERVAQLEAQLADLTWQLSTLQASSEDNEAQVAALEAKSNQDREALSSLEIQLSKQIAHSASLDRQTMQLKSYSSTLARQVAAVEGQNALDAWSHVKLAAIHQLGDLKSQADSLLFFAAQLDVFHHLVAGR